MRSLGTPSALADHAAKDGGIVWYGGGRLAPDLTLPKLRARWAGPADEGLGQPVHGVMARAVLRGRVTAAAEQARDEAGFFAQLRESGVLVRVRYSEINPGEVTGYAVAYPGYTERDGSPRWYGGGRLAAGLTLPQLRRNWDRDRADVDLRAGSFRLTGPEREQFYFHAAWQANAAAEQIRRSTENDPTTAADTAWAAAATFHATARAIGNPALGDVADAYDRAARIAYGKVPQRTAEGDRLRAAARLLAMAGGPGDGSTPGAIQLTVGLIRLARAVGELRQAEQHAAQAAAARQAAERLYAALSGARAGAPAPSGPQQPQQSRHAWGPRDVASLDFPAPSRPEQLPPEADNNLTGSRPHTSSGPVRRPPSRAGPGR